MARSSLLLLLLTYCGLSLALAVPDLDQPVHAAVGNTKCSSISIKAFLSSAPEYLNEAMKLPETFWATSRVLPIFWTDTYETCGDSHLPFALAQGSIIKTFACNPGTMVVVTFMGLLLISSTFLMILDHLKQVSSRPLAALDALIDPNSHRNNNNHLKTPISGPRNRAVLRNTRMKMILMCKLYILVKKT